MKANIERVVSRLEEIYQCGKQDDGTYTRMAFSKEDVEGRKLFASWAEKLGMTWRIDAAGFINQVPDITKGYGNEFTVATVGTIKVTPHSVNVIPGTCTFSLEIRDQSAEMMKVIETKLHERLEEICKKYKVTYTFTPTSYHDPAPMSELVRGTIEEAVKELKIDYTVIPSGAFHDSLIMTSVFPTGMIFVPSKDGISHSRYEYRAPEDIENGCNVLINTVLKLDEM